MTEDQIPGLRTRWRQGYRKVRCLAHWPDFAGPDWLDRIMTVEVMDRLFRKQGRSIARWTLRSADGRTLVVYLKRHYELPRLAGLGAWLWPRRAWSPGLQEWEHLAWAEAQGLPVPRAVAAGEWLRPGGRLQSFIAIEELADMLPLHQAVPTAEQRLDSVQFQRWKDGLNAELVRLSLALHNRGVFHKDWYLCHFYIERRDTEQVPPDWTGRVHVIDLHRLSWHRIFRPWRRAKDLAQLLYSSDVPGVTDADRRSFWEQYRKRTGLPCLVAWLARMKARIYQRKNAPRG